MKTFMYFAVLFLCFFSFSSTVLGQNKTAHVIYNGKSLSDGYDMGLNTGKGETNWLKDTKKEYVISYPAGQIWGVVFITFGPPQREKENRLTTNYSIYDTLIISMKGARDGEQVGIGLKDVDDPDNGSETKIVTTLSKAYKQYAFPLSCFTTANLKKIYVATEFVFAGNKAEKIFVNSIMVK
jgi:hypothetical protein